MIVVTGGAGFIGSAVVHELLAKGHHVRVVDNLSKPSSRVPEGVEFVRADLTKAGAAREAFRGVRACINLAAKIGGIGYFHRLPATILSESNRLLRTLVRHTAPACSARSSQGESTGRAPHRARPAAARSARGTPGRLVR